MAITMDVMSVPHMTMQKCGATVFVSSTQPSTMPECRYTMLSIDQMLKIDPSLSNLSDAELEEALRALYGVAQLAFEVYLAKKHGSKNPVGLLPITALAE